MEPFGLIERAEKYIFKDALNMFITGGRAFCAGLLLMLAGVRVGVSVDARAMELPVGAQEPSTEVSPVATFSILGFDPSKAEWGIAVQSKVLAVGALVPWAKANVGAIATQSYANTTFGPRGLELLSQGRSADETLRQMLAGDAQREQRQVAIMDAEGRVAIFTGKECLDWAGHRKGRYFAVQGNILAGSEVIEEMANAFESMSGDLGDRLVAALDAGQNAGGDRRGRQSSALLIVREKAGYGGYNDRYRDLRVDDHPRPIQELRRLYRLHKQKFPDPKN